MTDQERIDDAYERIDIDTDEILAFYDGERVERCVKSIWDSTVTMHQIATVALKENAKLRERVEWLDGECRKRMGASHKFFEMIGEYQKENAKLREFAKMFAKVAHEVGCDHCPYCDPDLCDEETDPMKDGCRLYEELRKLGVTDD